MASMSKERRGEIAYAILQKKLRDEGIRSLDPNIAQRSLGNVVKDFQEMGVKISKEEFIIFFKEIYNPLIEKFFDIK